jgi:glutamate 5-kinase
MVAPLVDADAVVFLTNVDGVLDENGQRIPSFSIGQSIKNEVHAGANLGRGGIESKIRAAHAAQRCGADVVVGPAGKPGALTDILAGKDIGTFFPRGAAPLAARKHWILFTLRPKGDLLLDAGAVSALLHDKRSLLAVGILGVRGGFFPGDAVRLLTVQGQELGRGLARLGALDVARAAGRRREDLEAQVGEGQDVVVVHRDDLVVHPIP